jgi:hypothetical protein
MEMEELVASIRKHFAFLFDDHGFELVYCGFNYLRPGYMLVGLQAETCRMLFEVEETEFAHLIGPCTAAFHEATKPVDEPSWLSVGWLIDFVRGEAPQWRDEDDDPSVDALLRGAAEAMRPHTAALCDLFTSTEAVAAWYPRYQEYLSTSIGIK